MVGCDSNHYNRTGTFNVTVTAVASAASGSQGQSGQTMNLTVTIVP
jgi:hypothetical protein